MEMTWIYRSSWRWRGFIDLHGGILPPYPLSIGEDMDSPDLHGDGVNLPDLREKGIYPIFLERVLLLMERA
jgi:hypothetical protein